MTEPVACDQVRTGADHAWENEVAPILQPRCADYLATHGACWQGLRTHTVVPLAGDPVRPDVGEATPPDMAGYPWPEEIRGLMLPMALRVDAYRGPEGPGYQVLLVVDCGTAGAGGYWRRVIATGPQAGRTVDWHALTNPLDEGARSDGL